MGTFAFIVKSINKNQLFRLWPFLKFTPLSLTHFLVKNVLSTRIIKIKSISAYNKNFIQGIFFILPSLSEGALYFKNRYNLSKIIAIGHKAERLRINLLGLDCLCLPSDLSIRLAQVVKIPITNGEAFTAWSVFEAIYRLAVAKSIDLKKTTLTVQGAACSLGSLCAKKLSDYVRRIILVDKNLER
ncbi:MAG: hypothetical protein NC908_03325, partial [Candidatus Omnitrophica bacterium]|nr:hypothetical protein [Candidatus Omnitrophota bacterium]